MFVVEDVVCRRPSAQDVAVRVKRVRPWLAAKNKDTTNICAWLGSGHVVMPAAPPNAQQRSEF